MDFAYSDKVKGLQAKLNAFMDEHVYPNETTYHRQIADGDRWQPTAIVETLKPLARAAALWNLFLPESEYGAGLTNVEYAPLCEIMGGVPGFGPEVFKCNRCGVQRISLDRPTFEEICIKCGADIHSCGNCRFFDTTTLWECRENADPIALERRPARHSPTPRFKPCASLRACHHRPSGPG